MKDDMKDNVFGVVLITVGILCSLVYWAAGWQSGYEQGQRVAHAYFMATNSTPTEEWAFDSANWRATDTYAILKSLSEKQNDW